MAMKGNLNKCKIIDSLQTAIRKTNQIGNLKVINYSQKFRYSKNTSK